MAHVERPSFVPGGKSSSFNANTKKKRIFSVSIFHILNRVRYYWLLKEKSLLI
jgi:hypothetical protein